MTLLPRGQNQSNHCNPFPDQTSSPLRMRTGSRPSLSLKIAMLALGGTLRRSHGGYPVFPQLLFCEIDNQLWLSHPRGPDSYISQARSPYGSIVVVSSALTT